MGTKAGLIASATVLTGVGLAGCAVTVVLVFFSIIELWWEGFALGLMAALSATVMLLLANGCQKQGQLIEPVEPMTDQNAHLLPPQDTLVRGSHIPPTVHQAELLRAVQTSSEAPPEQLLRAGQGNESP